jgi:hypothetical protein
MMNVSPPPCVREFRDEATGVTVRQVTEGFDQAGPLYFTRPSWLPDGRFVFVGERDRSANYYVAGNDGAVRQLTRLPAVPAEPEYTDHMHRRFRSAEGDRIMLRIPAVHPTRPLLVYAWRNEIRCVEVDTGREEMLHRFGPEDAAMPFTGLHTVFTADGRDLILVTTRLARDGENLDPPGLQQDKSLRDESVFVSKIWRYDFERRRMIGEIFASNGEQSHVQACPWDADLVLWVNYGHNRVYTARRDGGNLRRHLETGGIQPNHFNWDPANRRLICNLSDTKNAWRTSIISLDLETDRQRVFERAVLPHPSHISASPDGRWIALDVHAKPIGGTQGIHLLDQRSGEVHPLCRCAWSALTDKQGKPVKSEYFHPNPGFSPDGRWLVFGTDFGSGSAQVYAVDLETWQPGTAT